MGTGSSKGNKPKPEKIILKDDIRGRNRAFKHLVAQNNPLAVSMENHWVAFMEESGCCSSAVQSVVNTSEDDVEYLVSHVETRQTLVEVNGNAQASSSSSPREGAAVVAALGGAATRTGGNYAQPTSSSRHGNNNNNKAASAASASAEAPMPVAVAQRVVESFLSYAIIYLRRNRWDGELDHDVSVDAAAGVFTARVHGFVKQKGSPLGRTLRSSMYDVTFNVNIIPEESYSPSK